MEARIHDKDKHTPPVLIGETDKYYFFVSIFRNKPLRYIKHKYTNEVRLRAEDQAACMGFDSLEELFGRDNSLDAFNRHKEKYPEMPLFGDLESNAAIQIGEVLGLSGNWIIIEDGK